MKQLLTLGLIIISPALIAEQSLVTSNIVTFTDRYIEVNVPHGKCAGITLTPKQGISTENILLHASAINSNNERTPRGSVRLSIVPHTVKVKADGASTYRIAIFKLNDQGRPVSKLRPQDVFNEPEFILGSCNARILDGFEFFPLFMQSINSLPYWAVLAIIAGGTVAGATALAYCYYRSQQALAYTYDWMENMERLAPIINDEELAPQEKEAAALERARNAGREFGLKAAEARKERLAKPWWQRPFIQTPELIIK